jgi:Uma2 family endonuclease
VEFVMIAVAEQFPQMTAQEYLEWEAKQENRHEYVDGYIMAMSGATLPHNQIALNLYRHLYPHLQAKGCRSYLSDVKVRATEINAYFYPDLVVTCNERDLNARDAIESPTLIVEVLSPSTSGYDNTDKFTYYRSIPTLQEYILIDSNKIAVNCYRRGEGRMWLYYPYQAGDIVRFDSLDLEMAIDNIYEDINF